MATQTTNIYDDEGNVIGKSTTFSNDEVFTQPLQPPTPESPVVPTQVSAPTFREHTGIAVNGDSLDQYSVENLSYPDDLMANDGRYGGNYAIFYINVSVDSKLTNTKFTETVSDYTPRDRGDLVGMGLSSTQLVASAAIGATVIGGGVGALIGALSKSTSGSNAREVEAAKAAKNSKVKSALTGMAIANVPTVGIYAAERMTSSLTATRPMKRLKSAIALHIPNQLSIRYGAQWSEDDTLMLAAIGAGTQESLKALGDKSKLSDVGGFAQALAANLALSKGPFAGGVSNALGLAANPKKEQIFKGVDFRTFSMDYKFAPTSSKEAQNVLDIIQQFKYHMHPEFADANNFVYIYPSEFDISYYQSGKESDKLHKHTSCVLTDMQIDYTPNGQFSTFPDGMPTHINITLTFRELALLTKEKIGKGL